MKVRLAVVCRVVACGENVIQPIQQGLVLFDTMAPKLFEFPRRARVR